MKTLFKIIWISLLSTIVNILTKILVDDNFLAFLKLDEPRLERFHVEYILINIVVFILLTMVFIYGKKYLPSTKLSKGIVYSLGISLIWFALKFEPTPNEKLMSYILNIITFFIPMMIYGVFLGYLSSEKEVEYKVTEAFLSSFIYLSAWIFLRIIYLTFDVSKEEFLVFRGTLWIVLTGVVIGVIFGLLFDVKTKTSKQTFVWIFLVSAVTFSCFYLLEYTMDGMFNPYRFLALTLDIIAIVVATLISFKVFEKTPNKQIKE